MEQVGEGGEGGESGETVKRRVKKTEKDYSIVVIMATPTLKLCLKIVKVRSVRTKIYKGIDLQASAAESFSALMEEINPDDWDSIVFTLDPFDFLTIDEVAIYLENLQDPDWTHKITLAHRTPDEYFQRHEMHKFYFLSNKFNMQLSAGEIPMIVTLFKYTLGLAAVFDGRKHKKAKKAKKVNKIRKHAK